MSKYSFQLHFGAFFYYFGAPQDSGSPVFSINVKMMKYREI